VGKETPTIDRSPREEGLEANTGNDATLASYLSSLFFLLSVPTVLGLAYYGHTIGLYGYRGIVPAFAGLFIAAVAAVFTVMHVLTGR
jgi:hypothetical protein